MKRDIQARWIDGLLGGDYEQGSGVLRSRNDKFCCLGVLCDIIDPAGWNQYNKDAPYEFKYRKIERIGFLPESLENEVGLVGDEQYTLSTLNDGGGSFARIAAYIRDNIPAEEEA